MVAGLDGDLVCWDWSGRPWAGVWDGRSWRRSLAGAYLELSDLRRARILVPCSAEQGRRWDRRAQRLARDLQQALSAARGSLAALAPGLEPMIRDRSGDGPAFSRVYQPISILPPDRYLSLVLQFSRGCPWNRCTFCHFYRDRDFRPLDRAAARAHMEAVIELLGPGISLRRGIFLADANALAAPPSRIEQWLDLIHQAFPDDAPGPRAHGIYSFTDLLTGGEQQPDFWRRLARGGLTGVYLGLETGDGELLERLGKPGPPERAVEMVARIKQAGLRVGVILLAGFAGSLAAIHRRASLEVVGRLGLDRGDRVFVSPLVGAPDGVEILDPEGCREQARQVIEALRRECGQRAVLYDIRRFVY